MSRIDPSTNHHRNVSIIKGQRRRLHRTFRHRQIQHNRPLTRRHNSLQQQYQVAHNTLRLLSRHPRLVRKRIQRRHSRYPRQAPAQIKRKTKTKTRRNRQHQPRSLSGHLHHGRSARKISSSIGQLPTLASFTSSIHNSQTSIIHRNNRIVADIKSAKTIRLPSLISHTRHPPNDNRIIRSQPRVLLTPHRTKGGRNNTAEGQ